mgnify:CR=1 FL=1
MKLRLLYLYALGVGGFTGVLPGQTNSAVSDVHRLLDLAAIASPAENYSIVRKLTHFPIQEFDKSARVKVAGLLHPGQNHLEEWVLLAGFLNLKSSLRRLLEEKDIPGTLRQAIGFALVRCGDEGALQKLKNNIYTIPVDDDFVYQLVPLLVYTRRKEMTDYLLELVQKDDTGCTPADAETPGAINCAFRIMEYLAPVIRDFPLETSISGDLETDDYPNALQLVRSWIIESGGVYFLDDTTY